CRRARLRSTRRRARLGSTGLGTRARLCGLLGCLGSVATMATVPAAATASVAVVVLADDSFMALGDSLATSSGMLAAGGEGRLRPRHYQDDSTEHNEQPKSD